MRLIYAEEIKKRADCYPQSVRSIVSNILSHTKTVKDAVKVVRCKDCWKRNNEDFCPLVSDNCYPPTLPDDWFCKDGERREDDVSR